MLVVSGLAGTLAVGLAIYGVVNHDPSEVFIAAAAALGAGWTGRLVVLAFRRNSRELLPKSVATVERAVAKAAAKSAAKPRFAFTSAQGDAPPGTLRVHRRPGGRVDRNRGYELWVDDRLVGDLVPDQKLDVAIPPGPHTVHVAIDWCRSRRVPFVISSDETLALVCEAAATSLTVLFYVTIFCRRYIKVTTDPEAAAAQQAVAAARMR